MLCLKKNYWSSGLALSKEKILEFWTGFVRGKNTEVLDWLCLKKKYWSSGLAFV